MSANPCIHTSRSPRKHSYLISLLDTVTLEEGLTVVQTSCTHDIQEWLQEVARESGGLRVMRPGTDDDFFSMHNPMVVHIDAESAAHLPMVDPTSA